ncbi:hypothetical protein Bca52824_024251 [Brassica carinata]|uniref:Uncharacterized protein n=1 Tax=Brassica carinata TaxID=52824 RepID=A0A8X7VK47_BRACI|nr:hypothetical protein Bca52824_024251 [Brassica carinata]
MQSDLDWTSPLRPVFRMLNLGELKQKICCNTCGLDQPLMHQWILSKGYYVEVHSVGVTKGSAMERILGEIVLQNKSITTPIDYVLCIGNFLGKDEDIYTFFEPELTKKTKKVSSTVVA